MIKTGNKLREWWDLKFRKSLRSKEVIGTEKHIGAETIAQLRYLSLGLIESEKQIACATLE